MAGFSPLKKGDLVDVVSPGSSSRLEDVKLAVELLTSWGLFVRLPEETFDEHPFHSNEDEVRLKLFKKAISAKDSKAVWCLRGGYGANRLIPELLKMKKPLKAKPLIGYSDITSLHLLLNQKWKWPVYHGPLLETMISGRLPAQQVEECRKVLFGEIQNLNFELEPLNKAAEKLKKIEAPLIGGNLVVLESSIGTDLSLSTKGKILVLEEIGERGYRIDRMLEHLSQAKALNGCVAILFGDFIGGDEKDQTNFVQYAIERFALSSKIPCYQGLEIGHGMKNRILPLGLKAKLQSIKSEGVIEGLLTVGTGVETEIVAGKRK